MAETIDRPTASLHPVQAVLVVSTLPLFLGALLSDWAYSASYQIQWKNFASWLLVGGLVFTGLALPWSVIDGFRSNLSRGAHRWLLPLLLLGTFLLGFADALVHAKDAWASMPAGLLLSILTFVMSIAATWTALARRVRP